MARRFGDRQVAREVAEFVSGHEGFHADGGGVVDEGGGGAAPREAGGRVDEFALIDARAERGGDCLLIHLFFRAVDDVERAQADIVHVRDGE